MRQSVCVFNDNSDLAITLMYFLHWQHTYNSDRANIAGINMLCAQENMHCCASQCVCPSRSGLLCCKWLWPFSVAQLVMKPYYLQLRHHPQTASTRACHVPQGMLCTFAQKVCGCIVGTHGKLAQALASHLRPAVLAEFDKAMAAVFVAGAEVNDNLNLTMYFASTGQVASKCCMHVSDLTSSSTSLWTMNNQPCPCTVDIGECVHSLEAALIRNYKKCCRAFLPCT